MCLLSVEATSPSSLTLSLTIRLVVPTFMTLNAPIVIVTVISRLFHRIQASLDGSEAAETSSALVSTTTWSRITLAPSLAPKAQSSETTACSVTDKDAPTHQP